MSVLTRQKKVLREVHQHIAFLRDCDMETDKEVSHAIELSQQEASRIGSAYCLAQDQTKVLRECFVNLVVILSTIK
jgi:hypothetical protein